MPAPVPRLAVIFGDGNSLAMSATFGIVVDQSQVAIFEMDHFSARTGIGNLAVHHLAPRLAAIFGFAHQQALRRRTIVAHVRDQRAVFPLSDTRLHTPGTDEWRGRGPSL